MIRRAVELQSSQAARTDDGVSDVDLVRIGQDLGLDPSLVRRAMAEVRMAPDQEKGAMVAVIGARTVRASRVIPRPAAAVEAGLARYLRETELMVPQRRFPGRTRYVRDSSFVAGLERFARGFGTRRKPLDIRELDVGVSALDDASCLVEFSVDLGATRGGLVAGVLGSSGTLATGWAVTVWATAIANPLALLGVPLVAGSWAGMRAIYGSIASSLQDKLESLMDRVEHDDL